MSDQTRQRTGQAAPDRTPERWAAGVLPVAVTPEGAVVALLGKDNASKGGRWSDFAGGGEACDAAPRDTALRELDEETGGVVCVDLEGALEFTSTTPSGKTLHRYVVRVPFDEDLPKRFGGSKDDEKVEVAWFALGALPPLRHVFWRQMREDTPAIAAFALGGH